MSRKSRLVWQNAVNNPNVLRRGEIFLTAQPCIQTMKCYSVIKRNNWYVQQTSGSQGAYTWKEVDTEGWCCMIPLCLLVCFGFILFYFGWDLWCQWCGTVFKEKSRGGLLALFILIVLWLLPKLTERCATRAYLPIFELKKIEEQNRTTFLLKLNIRQRLAIFWMS